MEISNLSYIVYDHVKKDNTVPGNIMEGRTPNSRKFPFIQ